MGIAASTNITLQKKCECAKTGILHNVLTREILSNVLKVKKPRYMALVLAINMVFLLFLFFKNILN